MLTILEKEDTPQRTYWWLSTLSWRKLVLTVLTSPSSFFWIMQAITIRQCHLLLVTTTLWCAIHTLQLSIKEALKIKLGQVRVWKVVAQCKAVLALVRRSESNKDALKQACIRPDINLILPSKPGVTRWNVMEANIHSCLQLQPVLNFYDRSHTWSTCIPSVREFDVAEAVQKCLQPLKIAMKTWEADQKAPPSPPPWPRVRWLVILMVWVWTWIVWSALASDALCINCLSDFELLKK